MTLQVTFTHSPPCTRVGETSNSILLPAWVAVAVGVAVDVGVAVAGTAVSEGVAVDRMGVGDGAWVGVPVGVGGARTIGTFSTLIAVE